MYLFRRHIRKNSIRFVEHIKKIEASSFSTNKFYWKTRKTLFIYVFKKIWLITRSKFILYIFSLFDLHNFVGNCNLPIGHHLAIEWLAYHSLRPSIVRFDAISFLLHVQLFKFRNENKYAFAILLAPRRISIFMGIHKIVKVWCSKFDIKRNFFRTEISPRSYV